MKNKFFADCPSYRLFPGKDHVEQEAYYWAWRNSDQFEFDLLKDPDSIISPIDVMLMDSLPREYRKELVLQKKLAKLNYRTIILNA